MCGRHGNKAIFLSPPFLSKLIPRPSIPASEFPILALNLNYKQSKTKSVGGMETRLSMYVSLPLFFLNKQNKCFIVFIFCCEFPTVYSEWSEHHGHCTEGSGSGQYSGLSKWKSNALKLKVIFSLVTEVCKELYVC